MGKCGGHELNYVSDVDVVFVAETADQQTTRLASRLMRVAGEACFQVDANLRPEGRQGALVRTLDGHVSYYRRWAKTWEFQALLKARPVAGDPELGAAYADAVAPLVWSAARAGTTSSPTCRRCAAGSRSTSGPTTPTARSSSEPGGLRDVEFAVQLLQLVHGRTDESLRSPSTLDALAALARGGYVGRDDGANLAASYRFLRLLEHRLQLQRMRRTHLLPAADDTAGRRWLARAAGLRPDGRRDVVGVLNAEWSRNVLRVRRLHEKLFYRPLLTAVSRLPVDTARLSEKAAAARLGALGWASPEGALGHLRALTSGVSRAAAIQQTLLPVLLDELARRPDPDRGLLAYRRVSEALATTPWYLRLLRDEGLVAQRLMRLLGTSALVPDLLVRAPEVLRLLAAPVAGQADELRRDPAEVAAALRATVARQHDPDGAAATARSLRRHELLRVACADLLGLLDVEDVCAALSSVWVAVLPRRWTRSSGPPGRRAGAARRHRDGPARRGGAGLRQRRRRAVRLRAGRGRVRPRGREVRDDRGRDGPAAAGRAQPGPGARRRRRPAAGGPVRPAGPDARVVPRVLRALVGALGGAGAAAGERRGGRPGPRTAVPAHGRPDPVPAPTGSTPRQSPRSGGSRPASRRSGCRAAPTAAPTPSSATAGSPTSSGRCS